MKNLILFLSFAFLLIGCGASKEATPEWYNELPNNPNYLFATATATSEDMQRASIIATTYARAEIGRQVGTKIQGLKKKFDEETGLGEDAQYLSMFTQATNLSGSKVDKIKIIREGNIFRSYILVSYPIGAANQALVEQIKKNDQMYTRFRATKTFEELDKEAEKFEEFKNKQ